MILPYSLEHMVVLREPLVLLSAKQRSSVIQSILPRRSLCLLAWMFGTVTRLPLMDLLNAWTLFVTSDLRSHPMPGVPLIYLAASLAASGAFHSLKDAVFHNCDFTITTKRIVYGVTVLAILLYGSETWTPRQRDLQQMEVFHHQCLRSVLRVDRARQMQERISNLQIRQWWGDLELIADKIRVRRLEWLGHVSRMKDRIPRHLMFGSLLSKRPRHKPRKRWKDCVKVDLADINIDHQDWTNVAANRGEWRTQCRSGVASLATARKLEGAARTLICGTCSRSFRRSQDIGRHKCHRQPRKEAPVTTHSSCSQQQTGSSSSSYPCGACDRIFSSASGRTRHKCNVSSSTPSQPGRLFSCSSCGRSFGTASGRTRHKCR